MYVDFTDGALRFIEHKGLNSPTVQVRLDRRFVRGCCWGGFIPCVRTGLSDGKDSDEDFVELRSDAGVTVQVARQICEAVQRNNIPLTIATSGIWRFKKLKIRENLFWPLFLEPTRIELASLPKA